MQGAQAMNWVFTLNNPAAGQVLVFANSKYSVYQLEAGANGTPHYQGFVSFTKRMRLSSLKKVLPTAHWEVANGSPTQNKVYCTKEPRLAGPWEAGVLPAGAGHRSDLDGAVAHLKAGHTLAEMALMEPTTFVKYPNGLAKLAALYHKKIVRDVECHYIYGDTGIGKTHGVHAAHGEDDIYTLFSHAPLWFDGYSGQSVLIIDEYDDKIHRSDLLRILDKWHYDCPVKGGSAPASWTKVYVLANQAPPASWDAAVLRRFAALRGPMRYLNYVDNVPHHIHNPQTREEVKEILDEITLIEAVLDAVEDADNM